jgi:hypothetical protein
MVSFCVLLAGAGNSSAAEFPKDVCGVAEPLVQHSPERAVIDLDSSYGVAFSGGGSRSAAATIGQLRGLHLAGILPHVGYISAVSGGAWASTPYTYHPGGEQGIQTFLGLQDYRLPQELSDKDLRKVKKGSFAKALDGMGFFFTRSFSSSLRGKGNEIYSDIVGKELLKPFGVYNRAAAFGWKTRAGELETTVVDAKERHIPYLLMGGIVKCNCSGTKQRLPFEMSPLYTGVLPGVDSCADCPQSGYLQTYTIDNRPAPANQCSQGMQSYRIEKKKDLFTLSDALGITSSAPGVLVGKMMPFQTATLKTEEGWDNFTVRDGGGLDNLGLLPLLVRGVPNITVFVNSMRPISPDCSGQECKWRRAITSYFELAGTETTGFIGEEQAEAANARTTGVFQGNGEGLVAHLADRKRAGKIPYYCGKFPLSKNNALKLSPSYEPNICWVFLDRTGDWVDQLNATEDRLVDALKNQERPYRDFPHYSTFAAQGSRGQAADLDKKEILAIGHLTTWTVCEIAGDLIEGAGLSCSPSLQSQEKTSAK